MNQDANEYPTQNRLSQDLQLEIRDKHKMACKAVTNESDVDPPLLKRKANSTFKRQVCANDVAPPLVHTSEPPSHKHSQMYDWLPKFYFLKKHIAPKLPPIDVFSLSNKDAGDVDFDASKQNLKEIKEDAVDPKPHVQRREISKYSKTGVNQLPPAQPVENKGLPECVDGGVFLKAKIKKPDFDTSPNVDPVIYDYDGSHSVDAMAKPLGDDVPKGWHSVDAVDAGQGSKSLGQVNSEIFSDSADAPSSATDAPKIAAKDWEPQEAESILSDTYDLGEACICLVEDGCICSLEECICPDEDKLWKERKTEVKHSQQERNTEARHNQQQINDSQRRENRGEIEPVRFTRPVGKAVEDKRRLEGTSTDLHFHQSSIQSCVDNNPGIKYVRRKNNKLSERVICRRRFSPYRFETEVDPGNTKSGENVSGCDALYPDQLENEFHGVRTNSSKGKSRPRPTKITPLEGSSADAEPQHKLSSPVDARITPESTSVHEAKHSNVDANISLTVEAEVKTKCSTKVAESMTKSSICDFEIATKSSTVDAEVYTKSSTVDAEETTRPSFLGREVTTRSSTVDAEVNTKSSPVDTEVSTRSSTYDDEATTKSSTVDAVVITKSSTVDAEDTATSSAFGGEVSMKSTTVHPEVTTKYETVDADVTTTFSTFYDEFFPMSSTVDDEITMQSSTVDGEATTKYSTLGSKSTEHISRSMASAIYHDNSTKYSNVDVAVTKSSNVDTDFTSLIENYIANKCTTENIDPPSRLTTSPLFSEPPSIEEIAQDLNECRDDPKENIFNVLSPEQPDYADATADIVAEDNAQKLSSPRKSHSDPDAVHNSKVSMNPHSLSIDDTGNVPASYPSLKPAVSKTRLSRIPKPVAAKAGEKGLTEQQLRPGSDSQTKMTNTCKISLNAPPSGEKQNEPTLDTETKLPSSEASKPPSVGEEINKTKAKITSNENCSKPYVPQVITFYKHKDAKTASTIPPVSPKSRRTEKPRMQELPPWNPSTFVEKPLKVTRPPPLRSKRNDSFQSLVSSASESSKLATKADDPPDRMGDLTSGSASSIKSENDVGSSPHRSQVNVPRRISPKRNLPSAKQPFRPAGVNPAANGEHRKLIPASNTARSHPELRVPGGKVEVPVHYPSTLSDTAAIGMSPTKKGTKRAHEESAADNLERPSFLPDRNFLYPHSVPEAGVNENSNSVSDTEYETANSFSDHSFHSGTFSGGLKFPKTIKFDLRPDVEDSENAPELYGAATRLTRNNSALATPPIYYSMRPPPTRPMYYTVHPPETMPVFYAVHSPPSACVTSEIRLPRIRSVGETRNLGTLRSGKPFAEILPCARQRCTQPQFVLPSVHKPQPVAATSRAPVPVFDFTEARNDLIRYRSKMKKD